MVCTEPYSVTFRWYKGVSFVAICRIQIDSSFDFTVVAVTGSKEIICFCFHGVHAL